jgi:endogenous inhibitor of DNA gyrase (YacG/DUF329 family)
MVTMARSAYDLRSDTGHDWLTRALCRNWPAEWWTVSSRKDSAQIRANRRAREICGTCPVTRECKERAERIGAAGTIIAGKEFRRGKRMYRTTVISLQCPICRTPFNARTARQKFCSRQCKARDWNRTRGRERVSSTS